MQCLITGISGLIGRTLADNLLNEGHGVWGISRSSSPVMRGLQQRGARVLEGDILDAACLERAIDDAQPDQVFHLAAQSLPGESWADPAGTFETNVTGTIFLLNAIARLKLDPVIIVACSSAQYALCRDDRKITEDYPMDPLSPYGISKLAEEHASIMFAEKLGLRVVRARPFYLIGPGKVGDVTADFARGIVSIERGEQSSLSVGNLAPVRDLLDVQDGVEGLRKLAVSDVAGEVFNICSGEGYAIRDILEIMVARAHVPIDVEVDESRVRPLDEPVKIGDPSRLMGLGWMPQRDIQATLGDILDYWRKQEAC